LVSIIRSTKLGGVVNRGETVHGARFSRREKKKAVGGSVFRCPEGLRPIERGGKDHKRDYFRRGTIKGGKKRLKGGKKLRLLQKVLNKTECRKGKWKKNPQKKEFSRTALAGKTWKHKAPRG